MSEQWADIDATVTFNEIVGGKCTVVPGMDHGMDVRGIMSVNEKRWFLFSEVFKKAEAN